MMTLINTFILFSVLLASGFSFDVRAEEANITFEQSPKQCIALHYGQSCYVDIDIKWTVQHGGDYCLYSSQQKTPISCWKNATQGTYAKEVVLSENVEFYFVVQHNNKPIKKLAQSRLEMAWVYKKNARSRSSWRMF